VSSPKRWTIFTDADAIQKAEALHTFAPFTLNLAVWLLAPK
jgi:hypothetical protein